MAHAIDRETFEKMVDYFNCKCTVAYIETFREDKGEEKNIQKYDKYIKPILNDCFIDAPKKFNEFSLLLKQHGWSGTEKKLSQKIDKLKDSFNTSLTCTQLIEQLKIGDIPNLAKVTSQVQEELKREYCNSNTGEPQSNPVGTGKKQSNNQTAPPSQGNFFWLWVIVLGIFFIASSVCLWRLSERYILYVVLKSKRIEDKFEPKNENERKWQSLEKKCENVIKESEKKYENVIKESEKKYENVIKELKKKYENKGELNNNKQGCRSQPPADKNTPVAPTQPKTISLFASSINERDNVFYDVLEQAAKNTLFELILKNNDQSTAHFKVFEGAYPKVLGDPNFLSGCNLQRTGSNNVITEEEGVAQKQEDGKWIVTQKATIKFV
jgi:hypothetical protein